MNEVERWLLTLCDPAWLRGPITSAAPTEKELLLLRPLADHHGVLPAVFNNLRQAFPEAAASLAAAGVSNRLAQLGATSLFLKGMAVSLLKDFKSRGIPAIVIKGPAVASRAYRPAGLRTFMDIDLLIPHRAWKAGREVMTANGYEPQTQQMMKYAEGYGEEGWMHRDHPGCSFEVHWNLVNSPTIRRGVSVTIENLGASTAGAFDGALSPAALVLVAAVHGAASHSFDKLQHLCDVVQIVRGIAGPVDVDCLSDMVRATGAGLSVCAALRLAGEAFAEEACAELMSRLKLEKQARASRTLNLGAVVKGPSGDFSSRIRRRIFRETLKRRRP